MEVSGERMFFPYPTGNCPKQRMPEASSEMLNDFHCLLILGRQGVLPAHLALA